MKKFAVIAILMGIGAVPALAQNYDFTFSSVVNSDSFSGTLVTSGAPSGGGYDVTGGGLTIVSDNFTVVSNPTFPATSTFPPGCGSDCGTYDDVLFPNGGPANLLDTYGPLFLSGGSGEYVEIWQAGNDGYGTNPGANTYGFWEGNASNGYYGIVGPVSPGGWNYDVGSFTITAVPDGGTMLALLGLAVAGLAGLRRKLSV